jgi:putative transposase
VSFFLANLEGKMELYSFSHKYGQNAYHFVFCPKYRRKIFNEERVRQACYAIFYEIAERYKIHIYELRILPDHLHMFADIPPTMSVAQVEQLFKGISARELRQAYPDEIQEYRLGKHFSFASAFHRSVGNVTAETIQHYTQSQGNFRHSLPHPFY